MKKNKWEIFSHEADMGIRGYGKTMTESFAMAAIALTAVITDPSRIQPIENVAVLCEAANRDLLLFDWINTIIYEMDLKNMIFSKFDINIDSQTDCLTLTGVISGEIVNIHKHQPAVIAKGATYSELKVSCNHGIWVAQCIVDI